MNKKDLIMNNALKLFAKEGYEGVGVLKIVQASDVTKPTLYHYFGSKEGLLNSIYERYFNPFLVELEKHCDYENDVIKTIKGVVEVYLNFASMNQEFFWLSNHLRRSPMASESGIIVKKFHENEKCIIETMIRQISSQHKNLQGMENLLALNLMNLVNGYIENGITEQSLASEDDQASERLMKQFLYGIFSL